MLRRTHRDHLPPGCAGASDYEEVAVEWKGPAAVSDERPDAIYGALDDYRQMLGSARDTGSYVLSIWLLPHEISRSRDRLGEAIKASLALVDENRELKKRLEIAVGKLAECPMPDVDAGYDTCLHGEVWPCSETRALWEAKGIDVDEEVHRRLAELPRLEDVYGPFEETGEANAF